MVYYDSLLIKKFIFGLIDFVCDTLFATIL